MINLTAGINFIESIHYRLRCRSRREISNGEKFIQRFNGAKGLQTIPLQVLVVLANIKYWHL
jgi:hypothetical protein